MSLDIEPMPSIAKNNSQGIVHNNNGKDSMARSFSLEFSNSP